MGMEKELQGYLDNRKQLPTFGTLSIAGINNVNDFCCNNSFPDISRIDLEECKILSLKNLQKTFPNLRGISFINCLVVELLLPGDLVEIRGLDFIDTTIQKLIIVSGFLHDIDYVSLGSSIIEEEMGFGLRSTIKNVVMEGYMGTFLPQFLCSPTLKRLNAANTNIATIPPAIGNCTALEEFVLRVDMPPFPMDAIKELPPEFANLKALKKLELSFGGEALPDWFGDFPKLTEFTLRALHIHTLPEALGKATKLKKLVIHSDQFVSLHESIGDMSSLTTLFVHSHPFLGLPKSIGNCKKLQSVTIISSEFNEVPDEFWSLPELKVVTIQGEVYLSQAIANASKVTTLDLTGNRLYRLPRAIGGMKSLKTLKLDLNQIEHLPPELAQLPELKTVTYKDHRLKFPPAEVAARGWPAAKEWMLEHADEYPFTE